MTPTLNSMIPTSKATEAGSGTGVAVKFRYPVLVPLVVRVREDKPLVTDGPFMETKEQLAGYFLINAQDLNEAIRIATRVPGARIGTVEVRPLIEIAGLPSEK